MPVAFIPSACITVVVKVGMRAPERPEFYSVAQRLAELSRLKRDLDGARAPLAIARGSLGVGAFDGDP
jgi:hypothetical protein